MIYLRINEDSSITYPYSIDQLKSDNPNTSFPEQIPLGVLAEYEVYAVNLTEKGDDHSKNYTEVIPELVNNEYYQKWEITEATQEQIDSRILLKWGDVRTLRNQYLSESDWTQLNDAPFTQGKKAEWIQYRQALRDITLQPDPFNITWPTKPQ